jgi:hypothetical protein
MTPLASFGTLLCVVLACWFLAHIGWARRKDWSESHLLHGPADGCWECEDK